MQSVALRIIVDREEEIRKFKPEEYWSIDARLTAEGSRSIFGASFYGDKNGEIKITNKEQSDKILADLESAAFMVESVKKGKKNKQLVQIGNAVPPLLGKAIGLAVRYSNHDLPKDE